MNKKQNQPNFLSDDLPHQPSDIKPDEIKEHEQNPPEINISPKDHVHLSEKDKVIPADLMIEEPELHPFLEEARDFKIAPPPPTELSETHLTKTPPKPLWLNKFKNLFKKQK